MKSKRIRYGIKIYMLVDKGGKVLHINVFQGGSSGVTDPVLGITGTLVKGMVDDRFDSEQFNHLEIYMDNFFTGIPLALELLKKKIYITGTIQKGRLTKYLPHTFITQELTRGSTLIRHKDSVTIYKYHDKSILYLISTKGWGIQPVTYRSITHGRSLKRKRVGVSSSSSTSVSTSVPISFDGVTGAERSASGSSSSSIPTGGVLGGSSSTSLLVGSSVDDMKEEDYSIGVPEVVDQYNTYMGGIDQFDACRAHSTLFRASKRWNMKFFIYLLEVCVQTAWRLYREHGPPPKGPEGKERHIRYNRFKALLADELISLDVTAHTLCTGRSKRMCRVCLIDSIDGSGSSVVRTDRQLKRGNTLTHCSDQLICRRSAVCSDHLELFHSDVFKYRARRGRISSSN